MTLLPVHLIVLMLSLHVSCLRFNRTRVRNNKVSTYRLRPEHFRVYPDKWENGNFEFYFKLVDELGKTTTVSQPHEFQNSSDAATNMATEQTPNENATEHPRARIIGGEPAVEGEFKYQLSIRLFGRRHHCGAALTTVDGEQLAITAAHCIRELLPSDITLIAGDLTRSDRSGNEQSRQVVDIHRHPEFEFVEGVPSYDIALLFIDKPFEENNFVGAISMPTPGQETKGNVTVSGWGDNNPRYTGRPSDRLMKVVVPVVEFAQCKKSYSLIVSEFYDHFFCAGFMQPGVYKDSCQGDSGGPVRSEQGYLAGIVSWGAGCGIPMFQFPGVNTKVSYFTDWINDRVQKFKADSSNEEEGSDEDSSREGGEEEEGEDNEKGRSKSS